MALRLFCKRFRVLSTKQVNRSVFTEIPFSHVLSTRPIAVRGEQSIVGGDSLSLPSYIENNRASEAKAFMLKTHDCNIYTLSATIKSIVENSLPRHSALLFKNLPLSTIKDFTELMDGIGYRRMAYLSGNTFRGDHGSDIYDSTLDTGCLATELHNEMAYQSVFPAQVHALFFIKNDKAVSSPRSFLNFTTFLVPKIS